MRRKTLNNQSIDQFYNVYIYYYNTSYLGSACRENKVGLSYVYKYNVLSDTCIHGSAPYGLMLKKIFVHVNNV